MKNNLLFKFLFHGILSFFLLYPYVLLASIPCKRNLSEYSKLWTDSPFTINSNIKAEVKKESYFDKYALVGISPTHLGYRVTVIDKQSPMQRIILESHKNNQIFQISSVDYIKNKPLEATVTLTHLSERGVLKFDSHSKPKPLPSPQNIQPQINQVKPNEAAKTTDNTNTTRTIVTMPYESE